MRLGEGAHLGFRRGPDTWLARYRDREKHRQFFPLGEGLDYDEAKRRAEEWLSQLAGSAVRAVKRDTVKAALESYLADLRRHGRNDAAKEAEGRFKLVVYTDAIANLELERVTRDDFLEWRDRLLKGRQPQSVNRQVRSVKAALNRAVELGYVGNPMAWKLAKLSDNDEEETALYLNAAERKALIAAASANAGDFFRGLELTGARPKELAAALVRDFDGKTVRLAHHKGRTAKLRTRYTVLSVEGVTFFERMTANRPSRSPIFTEDGEQPWRRHVWGRAVRAAVKRHNEAENVTMRLPEGIGAYAFRHARISELLQLHAVDPLTVAAQTGTSLAMIEKAYLKFIPSAMVEKLAAVKES
jgi:integrase